MNYILSAFADEYSDIFVEQARMLQANGFSHVELRQVNGKNVFELTKKDVVEIKKVLDENGLCVSAIGSPIGKIKLGDDLSAYYEKIKKLFETAEFLGANYVRIFSFYPSEGKRIEEQKREVFAAMEEIVKISEHHNITLCHENEAKIYGESPDNCLKIAKYFDGKIRCVFDMGNFVLDGYNPFDAYLKLLPYIEYFHIKDALYAGAVVPAGKGEAQIQQILEDFKLRTKKDTVITLEPHLQTFAGLNALVGKSFENPYKYENQKVAFIDAIAHLKNIIRGHIQQ